jgi:hypothetical protein
MNPSKWDLVLDRKPIPLIEHLLLEVAQVFGDELLMWPPPVDEFDAVSGTDMSSIFSEPQPRPSLPLYVEAFKLARMELERNFEASAEYFRNNRHLEMGLSRNEKPMLLFVLRYTVEQLLALAEATEGRIKRAQLGALLDNIERYFVQRYPR